MTIKQLLSRYDDLTRTEALVALLALPDEPCMCRSYRYTQIRDPKRDPEVLKRDLGTAYVTHRRQDYGADISCVVSMQRLRIVRRA